MSEVTKRNRPLHSAALAPEAERAPPARRRRQLELDEARDGRVVLGVVAFQLVELELERVPRAWLGFGFGLGLGSRCLG